MPRCQKTSCRHRCSLSEEWRSGWRRAVEVEPSAVGVEVVGSRMSKLEPGMPSGHDWRSVEARERCCWEHAPGALATPGLLRSKGCRQCPRAAAVEEQVLEQEDRRRHVVLEQAVELLEGVHRAVHGIVEEEVADRHPQGECRALRLKHGVHDTFGHRRIIQPGDAAVVDLRPLGVVEAVLSVDHYFKKGF